MSHSKGSLHIADGFDPVFLYVDQNGRDDWDFPINK
jgi:hypothetical protein